MKKIILLKMDEMIRVQTELLLIVARIQQHENHHPNMNTWLDAQDVLEIFHLSARTLLRLRTKGVLPCYKLEGKIYYRKEDLDGLLIAKR